MLSVDTSQRPFSVASSLRSRGGSDSAAMRSCGSAGEGTADGDRRA